MQRRTTTDLSIKHTPSRVWVWLFTALLCLPLIPTSTLAETWPPNFQVEYFRSFSADDGHVQIPDQCQVNWLISPTAGTEMSGLFISEQFPTWLEISQVKGWVDGAQVVTYLQLGEEGDLRPGMVPHHFTFWSGGEEIELQVGQTLELEFLMGTDNPGSVDVSNNGFFGIMHQGIPFGAGGYDEETTVIQFDSTPLLLDWMRVIDQGDHLTLSWQLSLIGESENCRLLRGESSDHRTATPLGGGIFNGPGIFEYNDHDVTPGRTYHYWLALLDDNGEINGWLGSAEGQLRSPIPTGLNPAFPNPFNPHTTLSFALTAPGQFDLSIYDAQGRLVKSVASGTAEVGIHRFDWRGDDESGRPMPSGIYLSRLLVSDQAPQTEKLTLCR